MRAHIGRLIWVLLTNGIFIGLVVLGYSHEADLRRMLHPEQSFPLSNLIASDPWGAVVVAALVSGIALELKWSKAAAVVNCASYVVASAAAIFGTWRDKGLVPPEHITAGLLLYLVPVSVIAVVDIWLYRRDLSGLTPVLR